MFQIQVKITARWTVIWPSGSLISPWSYFLFISVLGAGWVDHWLLLGLIFFSFLPHDLLTTSIQQTNGSLWDFVAHKSLLIHSANPQSRPEGIIVFTHVVRPSVPLFKTNQISSENNVLLLARLWVWSSGSLMTPVLFVLCLCSCLHDVSNSSSLLAR